MEIGELRNQIISFTTEYEDALKKQTQSILELERLEDEIKKSENEILSTNETEEDSNEDETAEFIELEAKFEKLKLELAYVESEVELELRHIHPRATESKIKSLVSVDKNVHKLRNRIIDGKAYIKTKKTEIERERKEKWEKEKQKKSQSESEPDNDKVNKLKENMASVRQETLQADDKVEVLRKKLETLKLLVALATEK